MKFITKTIVLGVMISALSGGAVAGDWPQWGGGNDRNMASDETGLPESFDLGLGGGKKSKIDMKATRNVKWVAKLGSRTYGTPAVAGGRVFVGTNDAALNDPRLKVTRGGLVMCLDEATGKLLWQLVIPKFRPRKGNWRFNAMNLGVCAPPTVDGDRVYIVTSRGQVACLDVNGMENGNDGPFKDEGTYIVGEDNPAVEVSPLDADIIWYYDMILELNTRPEDVANSSVLVHGDLLYVCTTNGIDDPHRRDPKRGAPSLIVLNKKTGKLVAKDDEKIALRVSHGQWSSPASGKVRGKTLIFFAAGDNTCYAFVPVRPAADGTVKTLKKVWSCNCHVRQLIATPVFYRGRIYVATGQDPLHGKGKAVLTCIDATKTGDITKTGKIWTYDDIGRSLSTVAIADGLLYIAEIFGAIHCLDARTGVRYWKHTVSGQVWGSVLVADGKVYIGTGHKNLWVLKAGKEKKVLQQIKLPGEMFTSPVAANGTLFLATHGYLIAVASTDEI